MKKVLFFTYDFPYPTTSGGKNRAFNMMKFGKSPDVSISLFSFIRNDFQNSQKIEFQKLLGISDITLFKRTSVFSPRILSNPFSSIFKKLYFNSHIQQILLEKIKNDKIDTVHFESLYPAYYLSHEIKRLGSRQIFGTENIEYQNYWDYAIHSAVFPLKPFYFLEAQKIKMEEEQLLQQADIRLAVTDEEAGKIEKISKGACYVIENGIDPDYFSFQKRQKKNYSVLLFVGNFTYFPNVAGIEQFYRDVFSRISDKRVFLKIIGKKSTRLSFTGDKRVQVVDFVEDIRQSYSDADIFVSPLKIGGGTNFKVIEAMANGIPVVGYPQRIEALGAFDGVQYLDVRTPDEFLRGIDKILLERKLADHLSKNARKLVEEKYDWKKIGKRLSKIWAGA